MQQHGRWSIEACADRKLSCGWNWNSLCRRSLF